MRTGFTGFTGWEKGHKASAAFHPVHPVYPVSFPRRIVAELDAWQAVVDALNRLQAGTAAKLTALLPALLAVTMQFVWERVASRPLFSASRRKLPPPPKGDTVWFAVGVPWASRRDADWCDRNGRAPHFKCIVPA